jgi:hypothetical protein
MWYVHYLYYPTRYFSLALFEVIVVPIKQNRKIYGEGDYKQLS